MALRQVVIAKKLEQLRNKLAELKSNDFEERRAALATREAELEAAVNEITDETSEEDRAAVEEAVAEFEGQQSALTEEENANNEAISGVEQEIEALQSELNELNKKAAPPAAEKERKGEKKCFFKSKTA